MAELFGFEFKKKQQEPQLQSFAPKEADDGAVVIAAGGSYGTYIDLDGTVRTEAELVTKYREMANQPEVDTAIDEIVNESMSTDEEDIIKIDLEDTKLPDNLKKIISDEFKNCLNVLDFRRHAFEIYRRWYIDGRLYYHVVVDENKIAEGIKELRYVDPRKIRKIREVEKKRVRGAEASETVVSRVQNEYYIFNDKGFNYGNKAVGPTTTGLKIAKDSIIHVTSGLTDNQGTMVLSYLHKAIKPLNQLRTLEDAVVIYRIARAPERRVWYIDVGNLPKMKAEQYVREMMVKHKNRLVYDGQSGEIRDDRKFMTMLEDYWLPRREGGRGTEVTTMAAGQNLGQMEDVLYFQKKLYKSLNVPVGRLDSDAMFTLGRATEVTRDELKFGRFISRLRGRFSALFISILEKQLILKGVVTPEDWKEINPNIRFDFAKDNYFTELKDAEVIKNRTDLMRNMQDMLGKYYSQEWARRNILQQTEEDIKEQDAQIEIEQDSNDPRWVNEQVQQNIASMQQQQQANDQNEQMQDQADQEEEARKQKVQEAKARYDMLMQKPNKSLQDMAELKSVAQIVAKNKEI